MIADWQELNGEEIRHLHQLAESSLPDDPVQLEEVMREAAAKYTRALVLLGQAERMLARAHKEAYPKASGTVPEREASVSVEVEEYQACRDDLVAADRDWETTLR